MKRLEMNGIDVDNPLKLVEVKKPSPSEKEVLIQTKAFAVNPVDIKTRQGGGIYGKLKAESSIILGWDIAGEIVQVGEKVEKLKVGDKVFGMINFPGHGKAYAEYAIAPENHLALIPANVDYQKAAATTMAALTAYQVLRRYVKPHDKVFIQSAAGGVGHFAVQIAKLIGAYVIGTASAKNKDFLESIGLDEFVDYTKESFENSVSNVDFALDTMGGEILERTTSVVKENGVVISIPTVVSEDIKKQALIKNIKVDFELVQSNGADMESLAKWLAEGKLVPSIFKTFKFSEIELAHQQVLSGSTRGKVVVSLE